jgi:hypothetical protein
MICRAATEGKGDRLLREQEALNTRAQVSAKRT